MRLKLSAILLLLFIYTGYCTFHSPAAVFAQTANTTPVHDHGPNCGPDCDHNHSHDHGPNCGPDCEHNHSHDHGPNCGPDCDHDHSHDHGPNCGPDCDHDHSHGHDHDGCLSGDHSNCGHGNEVWQSSVMVGWMQRKSFYVLGVCAIVWIYLKRKQIKKSFRRPNE